MSNFKCPHCGMVNIDCSEKGYKTPEQIWLEEENERLKREIKMLSDIALRTISDYQELLDEKRE